MKSYRAGVWLALSLVIAGCGGTGGTDPAAQVLTGTLQAGNVQGVSFQTPTRSGTTDVEGRFQYLAGETVAFSVAGVSLGSVPGAPGVSLFTLAGLTPPTTERTLRRELDRAQRLGTPFARAINMAGLLMMLDGDGNPGNGLDVRDGASLLDPGTVDLDLRVADFFERIQRRNPRLTRNIPAWLSVAHLYRAVNVAVPVHAVARIDSPAAFGMPPRAFLNLYDSKGALSGEDIDDGADGVVDSGYRYSYDDVYRPVSRESYGDLGLIGGGNHRQRSHSTYDARGNIVRYAEEFDAEGDGRVDRRLEQELHYDAAGDMTRVEIRQDVDGDGAFEILETLTAIFDSHHNVRSYQRHSDLDGDGIADAMFRSSFTYDSQDRLLTQTNESDDDADGVAERRDTVEYTYAPAGDVTRVVYAQDNDLDGTPEYARVYETVYDRNGRAQSTRAWIDVGFDGIAEFQTIVTSTYDADARLLTQVRDEDPNADGVADWRDTVVLRYDDIGNLLEEISQAGQPDDSRFVFRFVTLHEYGADGQHLAYGSRLDDGSGSGPTILPSTLFTHRRIDDGVLHLAQHFFMHAGAAVSP